MKISTKTKLLTAAATVATSAFFASTVAIETAKAATFTLKPEAAGNFEKKWELYAPNAQSVSALFGEIEALKDLVEEGGEWVASYGGEELELGGEDVLGMLGVGTLNGYGIRVCGPDCWGGIIDLTDDTPGSSTYGKELRTFQSYWTLDGGGNGEVVGGVPVPEPSSAIALGVLGAGLVASRRRRRSK